MSPFSPASSSSGLAALPELEGNPTGVRGTPFSKSILSKKPAEIFVYPLPSWNHYFNHEFHVSSKE
jgi:hypothetical protein